MADRPTLDELKKLRDGQTSAGRPPPACERCGHRGPEVRLAGHRTVVRDGRRTGERIYLCYGGGEPGCVEEPADDGGES